MEEMIRVRVVVGGSIRNATAQLLPMRQCCKQHNGPGFAYRKILRVVYISNTSAR
jgi:hypothetical protein